MEISAVPTLYTWIRNNFLSFMMITVSLLAIYGAYQFIDGYAKSFGSSMVSQHEELKRAVSSYTALDILIQKPLVQFHASRITLFRLHDSERDVSLMSFFFASMANIVAAPGVEIDVASVANLPASSFSPVLPTLVTGQPMFVQVANMATGPLKELEMKRGVKSLLFIPIDDLQENMIGFLEVDWLSDQDVPTNADGIAMFKSLENDCIRISGYFSLAKLSDR